MDTWRTRIARLIAEQGKTMKSLSLEARMSPSTIHTWLKKDQSPTVDNLIAVAKCLGVSVEYLLTGDHPHRVQIPIVGIVSAGEGWTLHAEPNGDHVDFDLDGGDVISIEVRGSSMSPVYRNGDMLICSRRGGRFGDNLIGRDCVVMTADGAGYVKILQRGSRQGLYNLRSYNPAYEDISDVQLRWIAPVEWIKRGR